MRQGCRMRGGLAVLILPIFLAASSASAQNQDYTFCWEPSPQVDEFGNPLPPAVAYRIYCETDGRPPRLIATVPDTTCVLQVHTGHVHRLRVAGVDAWGREGPPSPFSEPVELRVVDVPEGVPPIVPELGSGYPNPFNPTTTLSYGVPATLASGEPITLTIHDLRGRRVREFRNLERTPGWHAVTWDGRDDDGRGLASGSYLVRFRCARTVRTTKVTLVG